MKRGIKTTIAGTVIFIFGAGIVPLFVILPLLMARSQDTQFKVPGIQKVTIENPGRYYLWNDYQTVYQGRTYNCSEKVPDGYAVKISDANGTPLNLSGDASISMSGSGMAKNTIGFVELNSPGPVVIEVSGGNEERIFSFSQSNLFKILGRILAGAGVCVLFSLVGVGIIIWGVAKLANDGAQKS